MSDSTNGLIQQLQSLGLEPDEVKIYLELLSEPSTHLQLSRSTGINRTKVYRVVEELEKQSLVTRRTDDRGTFLVASDPATLEVSLVTKEEELKRQHELLHSLIPTLSHLQNKDSRAFVVRTYEGRAGLKQMCWHELKAKGEVVALGNGTIEQITSDERWALKHREYQIAAGYKTRDLVNFDYTKNELPELASKQLLASGLYSYRILPKEILTFDNQTIVYNDTVAIYHWKHDQRVGVEIISHTYAQMMRQVFEYYWALGTDGQL
ncbi:MAG: TrmB family transcriptional regulator [Candidatus Saccharimonadales bacterium]